MNDNPYQSPIEVNEERVHESAKVWQPLWEYGIIIAGIFGVGLAAGLSAPLLGRKKMPDWYVVPFFSVTGAGTLVGLSLTSIGWWARRQTRRHALPTIQVETIEVEICDSPQPEQVAAPKESYKAADLVLVATIMSGVVFMALALAPLLRKQNPIEWVVVVVAGTVTVAGTAWLVAKRLCKPKSQ